MAGLVARIDRSCMAHREVGEPDRPVYEGGSRRCRPRINVTVIAIIKGNHVAPCTKYGHHHFPWFAKDTRIIACMARETDGGMANITDAVIKKAATALQNLGERVIEMPDRQRLAATAMSTCRQYQASPRRARHASSKSP